MMGRISSRRLALATFVVAILYFAFRLFSIGGDESFQSTKWFFEYRDPSSNLKSPPTGDDDTIDIAEQPQISKGVADRNRGIYTFQDDTFLNLNKCPVCFGTDICRHLKSEALKLDLNNVILKPDRPRKVVFGGRWHTSSPVVGKSIVPSEFSILDQHICLKANKQSNCDSASAARELFSVEKESFLSLENVQKIHRSVKKTKSDIPIAICMTERLITLFKKAFDEDRDGKFSENEQIMLYSSLASDPELVALKFLTKFFPSLPFPQYYGSCGRVFVVEGGVTPLKDLLSEPFHVRASLGGQLLQIVEDFIADEDSDWFVMFTDFSFDNLGVNKDGEMVLIDIGDIVLVDKVFLRKESEIVDRLRNKNNSREPCNKECLQLFTQQVLHSSNSLETCAAIPHYSHLMYAVICQRILSYLDEHLVVDFFNSDTSFTSRKTPYKGLLHSPPAKDKATLNELLQECVTETAAGGRVQAAEELRDYLLEFYKEDDGDDDNKNDVDDYDIKENGVKL